LEAEELLIDIVKGIVDDEDGVSVHVLESQTSRILELTVSKEDVGKVIGRGGRTADALRTILGCMGAKHRVRYILQIIDGGQGREWGTTDGYGHVGK